MSSLPIENIANIASFLPLREQMETFPEFNDCLKKVENKKKVIRRVLRNWYVDFNNENLNPGTFNFKRYTPLAFRKQLLEEYLYSYKVRRVITFDDMVDSLGLLGKSLLLRKIEKMKGF